MSHQINLAKSTAKYKDVPLFQLEGIAAGLQDGTIPQSSPYDLTAVQQLIRSQNNSLDLAATEAAPGIAAADAIAKEEAKGEERDAFLEQAREWINSDDPKLKIAGQQRLDAELQANVNKADANRNITRSNNKSTAIQWHETALVKLKDEHASVDLSDYSQNYIDNLQRNHREQTGPLEQAIKDVRNSPLDNWDELPSQYG